MRTAANTALILAILTLGSKILGFFREMFLANYYGTSYVVDAFTVATSIPGIIFAGILGSISTAFIPLFSQKNEQEGQIEADMFASQTVNLLLIVSAVSSIVGILFSNQIVWIFASGFEGETAELASFYVKITFSYTLFTTTAGIFDSYLRYKNIFIAQTLAGYSVSITAVIFVILSAHTTPHLIVFGTFTGNIIRLIIILIIAKNRGYRHRWNFRVTDTVKKIFYLAVPVFIGSSVDSINTFVNRALATRLPEGSAAAISYSNLITGIITGLTTTIIATILYPKMAQAFSQNDMPRLSGLYNSGISILLILGIPLSVGAMLYGEDVIQIVYERGAFDPEATAMTYKAFFYYSVGLVFMAINPFLVQTFYSMHDTKTPRTYAMIGVAVNIVTNLILVRPLAHGGLALGSSIAAFVNTTLLIYFLHRKTDIKMHPDMPMKIVKILTGTGISIGISYLFYYFVGENIWMPRMVLLGLTVIIDVVAYLLLLKLFKIPELIHIREIFHITEKPDPGTTTDDPTDFDK